MLVWGGSRLRVFLHPGWREFARASDHQYIEALIEDFKGRAKSDPEMLFQQASSLSVGPLVTSETGRLNSDASAKPNMLQGLLEIV